LNPFDKLGRLWNLEWAVMVGDWGLERNIVI